MSNNIVKFPTRKAPVKQPARRSYGTGVTILFNGTGLLANPKITPQDVLLSEDMRAAHQKWVAEGRPINACNLGPGPGAA